MRTNRVYILHPRERFLPGVSQWIEEAEAFLRECREWDDWDFHKTEYDEQNRIHTQPLHARVMNKIGPIVVLYPVQGKSLRDLRDRLQNRAIILADEACVVDAGAVFDRLQSARERFDRHEPFLPRKLVVAILIVRKLRKGNYWGGNEKGYLWKDELAKGRGVDERYADVVHNVADTLIQQQIMIFKISQGGRKYALNPKCKPEVHAIADDRRFENAKLEEILKRGNDEVSAHELLEPNTATRFQITPESHPSFQCTGIADMLGFLARCPDCDKYRVQVTYEGDRTLTETITSKHVLMQFFQAYL